MISMKRIAGATVLGLTLLFGYGLSSTPAQAGYVMALQETGGNIVAMGSGIIDLNGLTGPIPSSTSAAINPVAGLILPGRQLIIQSIFTLRSLDQRVSGAVA